MYKSPQRISISPVYRQKSDIDYYLVDRDVYPGKGTEYVRVDLFDALADLLEALEMSLKAYDYGHEGPKAVMRIAEFEEVARAAIAKAKGA